jgi:hypothetical protein
MHRRFHILIFPHIAAKPLFSHARDGEKVNDVAYLI